MPKLKDGCVKPAAGPIASAADSASTQVSQMPLQGAPRMQAHVGKPAIDFEANAFIEGKGFEPVKLSDYKGKWIVLCFYPGDFTFV